MHTLNEGKRSDRGRGMHKSANVLLLYYRVRKGLTCVISHLLNNKIQIKVGSYSKAGYSYLVSSNAGVYLNWELNIILFFH